METEMMTSVKLGSSGFNNSSLVRVMVQSLKEKLQVFIYEQFNLY